MRRLRRSIGVGAALTLLAVGAPLVGTASATHIACGTTITANTTLHSNIGPCFGDGLIIRADNITLNLNGHEIFGTPGDGGGNQAGIRLVRTTGVTVEGKKRTGPSAGTVREFDGGVVVNGGSGNTIRNLVVRDNIGPLTSESILGDGIVVFHSSANSIVNNVVTNNGRYDGIGVLGLGANNNTIRGNTVERNVGISEAESPPVGPGFVPHYVNAPGHGIIINHFLDQPFGTGEAIHGNNVMSNTVRWNDGSGISNVSNHDSIISGNVVEHNAPQYYGDVYRLFGDYPPSSVVGIGVSTGGGPELYNADTNVVVRDNVVNYNAMFGIHVSAAAGNQITNNTVLGTGVDGLTMDRTNDNSVLFNTVSGSLLGDLVDYSYWEPCDNRWWGNTWSDELGPLAIEFGFDTMYYPECTTDGPNGRGRPPSAGARPELPNAASGQAQSGARGFSGK